MYDIVSFLIVFFIIFFFYKNSLLSKRDLIIYSLFLTSPFFFNDVFFHWTSFYDQNKYVNTSSYIRESFLSGKFFYKELSPEKDIKVFFSSIVFSLFPLISFNTINSVSFSSKGIYLLTLIFLNYKKKIPFVLKLYLLFSPSIFFYSSLSLRDLLITSLMLLSFYCLISKEFGIKFILILVTLFLIKIQNFAIVLIGYAGYWTLTNFLRNNLIIFLSASIIIFFFIIFFDYIFFDSLILEKFQSIRMGFFSEIEQYTDPQWKEKYEHSYKIDFSYSKIFMMLKSFIIVLLFPVFSDLQFVYFIFSFFDLLITFLIFVIFFYKYKNKNKTIAIYWLLLVFIYIFILANINFNEITITRYKFPVLTFFLYCLWLSNQKISNK